MVWTDLSAEDGLQAADQQDGEDAEDEGEDGGEEEAPPLPLLQALLVTVQRKALWRTRLHPQHNSITLKQKHCLTPLPSFRRDTWSPSKVLSKLQTQRLFRGPAGKLIIRKVQGG